MEERQKLMEEIASIMRNKAYYKIFQVYEIFKDFFGEDKVDLQKTADERSIAIKAADTYISYLFTRDEMDGLGLTTMLKLRDLDDAQLLRVKESIESKDESSNTCRGIRNTIVQEVCRWGPFILVYFPEVRITNENGNYEDITELYAKVTLGFDGTICGIFSLNRAEYNYKHLKNNYMHSHVCDIPIGDWEEFQVPCTGSGPINGTITRLSNEYDEDIWRLFCLELSKYVTVESLDGIPYHHLENLNADGRRVCIDNNFTAIRDIPLFVRFSNEAMNAFFKYFINQKILKFNYIGSSYAIGMSFIEYITTISNCFIKWVNETVNTDQNTFGIPTNIATYLSINLLKKCVITEGKIMCVTDSYEVDASCIGAYICEFKGRSITLNITEEGNTNEHFVYLLNENVALAILTRILKILNYNYGRENSRFTESGSKTKFI